MENGIGVEVENSSLLSVQATYALEISHWILLFIPSVTLHCMLTFLLFHKWKEYACAFYVYILYLEFIDIAQLFLLAFMSLRNLWHEFLPPERYPTVNYIQYTIWATVVASVLPPHCAMMITRYLAVAKPLTQKVIN